MKFCDRIVTTRFCDHPQVLESMVARDGIEPPTPAFSGLDSTVGK